MTDTTEKTEEVHNFFTPAESNAFVKVAESIGFVHQGSLGSAYSEAYRDNDRVSMYDPNLADEVMGRWVGSGWRKKI
ncbi:hypothetical protein RND71_013412 [Anisodus tanguticus]|uniref:Uncharacterized protein n=1 Tax=Anisodus tanguticus TaxID=243964 RepID=A0AAE1SH13_9SOLA|nr:hypothetical protein RND71_013412 [Anisodus tanguticus]